MSELTWRWPSSLRSPSDWSDVAAWNRYLKAHDRYRTEPFSFSGLALGYREKGWKRLWFPGCGLDVEPRLCAILGLSVLATDFSPVAIQVQRRYARLAPKRMFEYWSDFAKAHGPFDDSGRLEVGEHDFVTDAPPGVFDAVINCGSFQGLSRPHMNAAARHFFAALRSGGAAIFLTMNVAGDARDALERTLTDAGFLVASISRRSATPERMAKVAHVVYRSA